MSINEPRLLPKSNRKKSLLVWTKLHLQIILNVPFIQHLFRNWFLKKYINYFWGKKYSNPYISTDHMKFYEFGKSSRIFRSIFPLRTNVKNVECNQICRYVKEMHSLYTQIHNSDCDFAMLIVHFSCLYLISVSLYLKSTKWMPFVCRRVSIMLLMLLCCCCFDYCFKRRKNKQFQN